MNWGLLIVDCGLQNVELTLGQFIRSDSSAFINLQRENLELATSKLVTFNLKVAESYRDIFGEFICIEVQFAVFQVANVSLGF